MPSPNVGQYGLDPDDGHVTDFAGFDRFLEDHPEWVEHAGRTISFESAIRAWDAGAPTPDEWAGITIVGEDDGSDAGDWAIIVDTETGEIIRIDLDDYYDLAWDYYDAAEWYGYEVEKDIDTGGPGD